MGDDAVSAPIESGVTGCTSCVQLLLCATIYVSDVVFAQ